MDKIFYGGIILVDLSSSSIACSSGYFPWPQLPLKSSRSNAHTMMPPIPLLLTKSTCTINIFKNSTETFWIHWNFALSFCSRIFQKWYNLLFQTLWIIISNPLVIFDDIWNLHLRNPVTGTSSFQHITDLIEHHENWMIFYKTIIRLLYPYEINSDLIVCEEAGFSGVSTSLTTVPSVWGEQSIVTGGS